MYRLQVKAKAMRKSVDKMVVLAKEGGEHSRRQVQPHHTSISPCKL